MVRQQIYGVKQIYGKFTGSKFTGSALESRSFFPRRFPVSPLPDKVEILKLTLFLHSKPSAVLFPEAINRSDALKRYSRVVPAGIFS